MYRDDQVNREHIPGYKNSLFLALSRISVCLSVCINLAPFVRIFVILEYFIKTCREDLKLLEIGQIMGNINFKEFMTNCYIFPYYNNYFIAVLFENVYLLSDVLIAVFGNRTILEILPGFSFFLQYLKRK
jgi:hypothetical protein